MSSEVSRSPSLRASAPPRPKFELRTSSYLREHQQYRPPPPSKPQHQPESHYGIDTVVEDLDMPRSPTRKPATPFKGIPDEKNPPTIVEGMSHDLSHQDCVAPKGEKPTTRLVATILYKPTCGHNHSARAIPARSPSPAAGNIDRSTNALIMESLSLHQEESIPANLAPTSSMDNFPLEPPSTTEPEPLDHLYGSYISPFCVASFLHLMSTFPLPPGEENLHSSHRCLDDPDHPHAVELTLSPAPSSEFLSLAELRKHELINRFEREWNVDVILQEESPLRRHPRLVVFDMDSTLITQEVIDLMAATIKDPPDLAARISDITHRAMLGELEFDGAFRERVKLLTGLSADIFTDLRSVLQVTPGVKELIPALKRIGVKTAVLSGGFLPLTSWLAGELGIDHAHANEVVIDEATNTLTGEVRGTIVGKERKRELLLEIAKKEGIDLSQVIAVGDGANDLMMMAEAGLGVAWNAKPMVQMEAGARLNTTSLLDLMYLFGFNREEIEILKG